MTRQDKKAIDAFLASLIKAVESKVAEYNRLAKLPGGESLRGQVAYWKNVASGYRWGRAINKQRSVTDA